MLRSVLLAILIAVGLFIAGLAKGVASLPVLLGVLAGSVVVYKSARPLLRFGVVAPLALGAGGAIGVVLWVLALNDDPDAVRETGQFLWTNPFGTLVVLPIALISALPTSLAWLFPWGKDARAESLTDHQHAPANAAGQVAYRVARFLSLAWLFAALVYMLAGVSNPRYLLPASVLLPPIVGYIVSGLGTGAIAGAWFLPARARLARLMLLGSGRVWCTLLLVGSLAAAYLFAHREEAHAGERVGRLIAGFACTRQEGGGILGDGAIEARPDVFLYAERAISDWREGSNSHNRAWFLWRRPLNAPMFGDAQLSPHMQWGLLWVVRVDPAGNELPLLYRMVEMRRDKIGKYELAIMREDGEAPIRDESDAFR